MLLACNKVDTASHDILGMNFISLGLDSAVHSVSAPSGYGTGELLDELVALLPVEPEEDRGSLPRLQWLEAQTLARAH